MAAERNLISTTKPCLNDPGYRDEPTITIDVERLIETRMLVEANSGAGKSYTLRRILEQTYGHAQHLVIDVEGEFHTLREKYDYVLCAPRGGDCVADVRSAALLARRLLELGASAIIDIYELGAQQTRFVKLFLESLMSAPRDLWHSVIVVVDEAHKFCAEKDEAESANAVIDLMTRGRKRGFCGVLATQRLSKLDKDAAAEANNLLVGRTSLDLDISRAALILGMPLKEARTTLPKLAPGEFFCVGPALSPTVERIHIGHVETSHPKAGSRGAPPTPARDKVRAILAKLADLPAEAEEEAKTMGELRAKVRELEARLTSVADSWSDSDAGAMEEEIARLRDELRKQQESAKANAAWTKRLEIAYESAVDRIDKVLEAISDPVVRELTAIRNSYLDTLEDHVAKYPEVDRALAKAITNDALAKAITNGKSVQHKSALDGPSYLPAMQRAILTVLAQRGGGPISKSKILVWSGYSRGGATSKTFAELVKNSWVTPVGDGLEITRDGLRALGSYTPLPTGRALRSQIQTDLADMERKIFDVVCEQYPQPIAKQDILDRAGYSRGGATSKAFAYLVARDYLVADGPGRLRAAQEMFE